jgi:hypothetical protein
VHGGGNNVALEEVIISGFQREAEPC